MAPLELFKTPSLRPSSPGPLSNDFARQQVAKQQKNNYHSSSLSIMNVNQTNLHPGGVQYVETIPLSNGSRLVLFRLTLHARPQKEHTELEEELHETAHIDYERVAIVRCPPPSTQSIDRPLDWKPLCCGIVRRCSRV